MAASESWALKLAERYLYDYTESRRRAEALRGELKYLDGFAASESEHLYRPVHYEGKGYIENAATARLARIEEIEAEILSIEAKTKPIETLMKDLAESKTDRKRKMLEILDMRYRQGAAWQYVINSLNISMTNCFTLRRELKEASACYLGLDLGAENDEEITKNN